MRKLGINWGKSNTYGGVTKQCYVTHLYHEPFLLEYKWNSNAIQLFGKQSFDISDNNLTFTATKSKRHSYGRYLSPHPFLQDSLHLLRFLLNYTQ